MTAGVLALRGARSRSDRGACRARAAAAPAAVAARRRARESLHVRAAMANVTANIIRNVWSYAIIFCGHFPDQTYTFSQEEVEDETRGAFVRAPAARRGEHRRAPALPRDQRQPRLPGRAPPVPGHAQHPLRRDRAAGEGRSASVTSCRTTPGRSPSSSVACSARSCGWRSPAAIRGRSPGPTRGRTPTTAPSIPIATRALRGRRCRNKGRFRLRAANLRDPEANSGRLLRRPDDAARGGADLLLADVAVPGGAARDLAAGPDRRVPGHLQRDHRLPAQGGAGLRGRPVGQLAAHGPAAQGHRRHHADHLDLSGVLRHDRRPRGRPARDERDLRRRPWATLPDAQGHRRRDVDRPDDPGAHDARADLRRRALRRRPARLRRDRGQRAEDLEPRSAGRSGSPSRCSRSRSSTTSPPT